MNIIRYPIWLFAFGARLVLMIVGVFLVPIGLIGGGQHVTPWAFRLWGDSFDIPPSHDENRWTKYVWLAWRNPVEGADSWLTQPEPEARPNPDELVRVGHMHNGAKTVYDSAERFTDAGLFWEYWTLSKIHSGPWKGRYWEFRIGWKFVDGNEDFVPTIQLGPRK